ncbi:MAG: alkaline phosphatase family protein [Rikenellaceae bacterium]|nr:alkaline phosphatase family protein [Rikenellaceae bacterium]
MKRFLAILILLGCTLSATARTPRLVVQIVVSSMRAGDLERYADNFTDGGFKRLMVGGAYFTEAHYNYQQTTTPTSLATLTTGAMPSMHGIVGETWFDYTDNSIVRLTSGRRGPGAYHLVAPTLGEALLNHYPEGKSVSIALESTSAIVMAGHQGEVYWLDNYSCEWLSSIYYTRSTPEWLARSNREGFNISYLLPDWRQILPKDQYHNSRYSDIRLTIDGKREPSAAPRRFTPQNYGERMGYTPAGNSAVIGLAKQAIAQFKLGADKQPDLLNICFDSSRHIHEVYGPESIEVEDMYYRLDRELADFFTFLFAQVEEEDCLVVLTSDHGTSRSYDLKEEEGERFNVQQFRVIANGFLNVRYGTGVWVLGYRDGSLYLNHNLIYERNLNLEEVQNEVAIFAQQFSGVSHAISATALRNAYFGSGYAHLVQNGFYPRRSGDVILNLVPGLIEERESIRSTSGSMYGYDRHVPLIFYGNSIGARQIDESVDMTAIAPTLAYRLGMGAPEAAEGKALEELRR